MVVSKEKLINGIAKFIESDLIPQIGDRNTKFVLAMAKDSLKEDEDILNIFFESPMVSSLVAKQDGMYDITHLFAILKNVLAEYQSFPITIPKIPLFSPTEKILKITAEEVNNLMQYIQSEEM